MRIKLLLFALLASMTLLGVSCTNEKELIPNEKESSITIKLGSVNTTKASGTPANGVENAVHNFTVYVFYSNGSLEKSETVTSGLEKKIDGLTAGDKLIAVIANMPSGYPAITNYSALQSTMFDLSTQDPEDISTNGLAMSGEDDITLNKGSNSLILSISRIVSKIQLGSITIAADPGHDPTKFQLVALHVMKARATSNMGIPTIVTGDEFYGGTSGTLSTAQSYLTEDISAGHADRYFYVFPNDDTDSKATLLTIEATYDGVTTYFPFRINDKKVDENDGSGEYIKRNTVHLINVTLKRLNGGTTDPEQPADPADLTVTVEPQEWETIPAQNVEW